MTRWRLALPDAELPAFVHSYRERGSGQALAFVVTNRKDESITSGVARVLGQIRRRANREHS
jgi:hypothetical protein